MPVRPRRHPGRSLPDRRAPPTSTFSVSRANVAYGARMYLAPPYRTAAVFCTVSAGLTDTPETTGLAPAERGVERLGPDERRAGHHGDDGVVVGELLAALLAFLLRVGDVAGHHLERVAADATGLLVDVLDRGIDAVDVRVGDLDRAALLVEVADLDRRLAGIGCARPADVAGEVGHLALDLGRCARPRGRCARVRRSRRGLGRCRGRPPLPRWSPPSRCRPCCSRSWRRTALPRRSPPPAAPTSGERRPPVFRLIGYPPCRHVTPFDDVLT